MLDIKIDKFEEIISLVVSRFIMKISLIRKIL